PEELADACEVLLIQASQKTNQKNAPMLPLNKVYPPLRPLGLVLENYGVGINPVVQVCLSKSHGIASPHFATRVKHGRCRMGVTNLKPDRGGGAGGSQQPELFYNAFL